MIVNANIRTWFHCKRIDDHAGAFWCCDLALILAKEGAVTADENKNQSKLHTTKIGF
jgi:hypothetical protein